MFGVSVAGSVRDVGRSCGFVGVRAGDKRLQDDYCLCEVQFGGLGREEERMRSLMPT